MIRIKRSYSQQLYLMLPINSFTRWLYRMRVGNYARLGTTPMYRINLWRLPR